jgi:parvulin-like peptidyl-prolyl isomerase
MLQKGAKFSDVAIENSEGPKAHAGGDQGWKRQDTLPPQIRAVVEQAKVGEITDLVELPTQAYIFYIENRRGGERQSLAQAQAGIENELRSQKFEKLYNEWTQGLRKEFPVFRYDPDLSAVTGE